MLSQRTRLPTRRRNGSGGGGWTSDPVQAIVGLLLVTALAGWMSLVSPAGGFHLHAAQRLVLLAAIGFAAGCWLTRLHGVLVPLLLVAWAFLLGYLRNEHLFLRGPYAPLGYSNALGSCFMLATAAALQLSSRSRLRLVRHLAAGAAVLFALVPFLNRTAAAAVLVCFLPLGLLADRPRRVRASVLASAVAVLVTLGAAVALGASHPTVVRKPGLLAIVEATLSERRLVLWYEAITIARQNPVTGIGIGGFPLQSPTAREDADTPWPHNEPLHLAAESGLPGMLLYLTLFAWGFLQLWRKANGPPSAIGAIALGGVGVHANVDYILHFPLVVLFAVLIVATATIRAPATGPVS